MAKFSILDCDQNWQKRLCWCWSIS